MPTEGGEGWGHIVAAPAQLVSYVQDASFCFVDCPVLELLCFVPGCVQSHECSSNNEIYDCTLVLPFFDAVDQVTGWATGL